MAPFSKADGLKTTTGSPETQIPSKKQVDFKEQTATIYTIERKKQYVLMLLCFMLYWKDGCTLHQVHYNKNKTE